MVLVDIHGSCLSRNIFNVDKDTDILVNNYISRSNIVSSMMPPADINTKREELLFLIVSILIVVYGTVLKRTQCRCY
ncbi:DUF6270 domain-containing protein [Paenibacillus amylolyticus]|uniref:DUF6270 domain-containing protein n=1 Tax=Paenibacillus amylolyticus TaxID=1451 RepID=UPI003D8077A6